MTHACASGSDVLALLRAAAHELLPVVVDLGPEQARFSTFISSLQEDNNGAHVVLAPIGEALPEICERPVRIVPASGAGWFVIAQGIERAGQGRARVPLARARAFEAELAPEWVAVPETELLVLVVPGGLRGSSSYVFPVQRIGADVCEIRSDVAMAPGHDLECVEVVGDRRLLRRASAQVIEAVPSYLPDGSKSFNCRLSLRDDVAAAERERQHDLVTDAAEVRRLLDLAGMMRCEAWYEAPGWGRGRLRFVDVGKAETRLDLSLPARTEPTPGQRIRIGVELFAVSYELDVRVISAPQGQVVTSLPLILRRRHRHRRDDRIQVPSQHKVEISFRNPVNGAVQIHEVAEISFFGVSFDCPMVTTVLWRGLPLEQAQLTWRNQLVHLGDLTVESYGLDESAGRVRCVASISQSRITDDPDMICMLATLAHPQIRAHDGSDFTALHRTYMKAGLFGPHMVRNLEPIFDQTARVWRTLHTEANGLVRTFVHGPEAEPDAAVTIVRAWEHAWVSQHFVDTSPEVGGAGGKLQQAYLDHVVPRPDGRYLVFFVKTDNRVMNAYLRRFFSGSGTPDAVTRSVVELWSRPATTRHASEGILRSSGSPVRDCTVDEQVIVARAAQRCFGAYGAGALSMIPGEFELPDTAARFALAGLERGRDCRAVTRDSELVYALMEERATPGMNLTWMLNATWVLPVHPELDSDGSALDAALRAIVERPPQTATGELFLNLPEGSDHARLAAWGFVKEASVYLYALSRAGLHRYFHYTAGRYGELDALALRRARRRARNEMQGSDNR